MPNFDTKNWMSHLDDSLTLDQLSIPGTHDSGTAKVSEVAKGFARCQNFDIATQLNDGIRFLDIRVKKTSRKADPLDIYHGDVYCGISLGNVLDACVKFLSDNNKEIIIFLMNSASGKDKNIQASFDYYLKDERYRSFFYLNPKPSNLGGLRGKLVLFRRFYSDEVNMGVNLSSNWKDNNTFDLTTPAPGNIKFYIEDQYSQHNTGKKLAAVVDNLKEANDYLKDGVIYITYNSISHNIGGHTPYMYAWGAKGIDPAMNPSLANYLKTPSGHKRLGIVVCDFYNNKIGHIDNTSTRLIINSNPF